jgi:hypothetical protein
MTFEASVTLESQTQAPRSYRVTVEASSFAAGARKAASHAKTQLPGARWSSAVIVLQKTTAEGDQ